MHLVNHIMEITVGGALDLEEMVVGDTLVQVGEIGAVEEEAEDMVVMEDLHLDGIVVEVEAEDLEVTVE